MTEKQQLIPTTGEELTLRKDFSFINTIRETFPAHYSLFNAEIYFSNMLLSDFTFHAPPSRLSPHVGSSLLTTRPSLTYQVVAYVVDLLSVTLRYRVSPFLSKQMANLIWLIRYKILFDNLRLHSIHHRIAGESDEVKITENQKTER